MVTLFAVLGRWSAALSPRLSAYALLNIVVAVAVTFVLTAGFKSRTDDLLAAPSPLAVLARDRRATLTTALAVAAGTGGIVAVTFSPAAAFAVGPAAGLAFGLWFGVLRTAWPRWVFTRAYLASRHAVPVRLMAFLQDAHRRGVLRQSGAVYQFRHIELQRRLAGPASGAIASQHLANRGEAPNPNTRPWISPPHNPN